MTALALALVILSSLTPARATPSCEASASSAEVVFLNLVRDHVEDKTLPESVIPWLISKSNPQNPVNEDRSIENLALRDGFNRVLRKLNSERWPYIVDQLKIYELSLKKQSTLVEKAKEKTRSIFSLLHKWDLKPIRQPDQIFVSSKGEIFGVKPMPLTLLPGQSSTVRSTHVINYSSGQSFEAHTHNSDLESTDFYETRDGRVIFANLMHSELSVIDAKTGAKLLTFTAPQPSDRLAPMIFERDGRLKVAFALKALANESTESDFPIYIVDVLDLTTSMFILTRGSYGFSRLSNGHAYVYGARKFKGPRGKLRTHAMIYDITAGQRVFDFPLKKGKYPCFFEDRGEPRVAFLASGGFGLYVLSSPGANWALFDSQARSGHFNFFTDEKGEAWLVRVERFGKSPHLAFRKVNDPTQLRVWKPDLAEGAEIYNFTTASTPLGRIFVLSERMNERTTKIHYHNFTKNESIPLASPSVSGSVFPMDPFYLSEQKRLMIPLMIKSNWSIYQLWGKDFE